MKKSPSGWCPTDSSFVLYCFIEIGGFLESFEVLLGFTQIQMDGCSLWN